MLGFVSRLVGDRGDRPDDADDLGGADGSDRPTGPDDAEAVDGRDDRDGRDERQPIRLYECPDCESVYLSEDLSTCRSCDTRVDSVPSEHDLGYGSARSR